MNMKLKDWRNISLRQFYQIQDLLLEPDDYTTLNLLDIIYDIDSFNMPLTEFGKYKDALAFISKEVPVVNLEKQYELNGTVYNSNYDLSVVTTALFIDYQNYIRDNKGRWEDVLSVFFIPEGHSYNDGYDMKKAKDDIMSLDFATVNSVGFFFRLSSEKLYQAFLSSLKKSVKKKVKDKEKKKELIKQLEALDLINLESYLLSLVTAKKPTQDLKMQ